jgi:hypothetical protein
MAEVSSALVDPGVGHVEGARQPALARNRLAWFLESP